MEFRLNEKNAAVALRPANQIRSDFAKRCADSDVLSQQLAKKKGHSGAKAISIDRAAAYA
jgi:hypothetical protein